MSLRDGLRLNRHPPGTPPGPRVAADRAVASYLPDTDRVRLTLGPDGAAGFVDLTHDGAKALVNSLTDAMRARKLAARARRAVVSPSCPAVNA